MEQEGDDGGLHKFFQHGTSLSEWIAFQLRLVILNTPRTPDLPNLTKIT